MNIEFQKTIILLSVIFILFLLYLSNQFDRNGSRENNYVLFGILIFCCFLSVWQIRKIKNWEKEEKTDYYLVYNMYFLFMCLLFIYCSFIIVTRSKLECFKIISSNLDIICEKMVDNIKQEGGFKEKLIYGLESYKYIWKKMLFLN